MIMFKSLFSLSDLITADQARAKSEEAQEKLERYNSARIFKEIEDACNEGKKKTASYRHMISPNLAKVLREKGYEVMYYGIYAEVSWE